jgi:hypothetical protein
LLEKSANSSSLDRNDDDDDDEVENALLETTIGAKARTDEADRRRDSISFILVVAFVGSDQLM